MQTFKTIALFASLFASTAALATPATEVSPTGGTLPAGVTKVGGIVADLKGTNGVRVVSQLAASSLYVGFAANNPQLIGTQTGFTAATLAALGGGLQSASFRVTLYDGDSAPGDFDENDNSFLVNGVDLGSWGAVFTDWTDNTGATSFGTNTGFGNEILSTGFFTLSNAGGLSSLFTSLGSGSITYEVLDADPFDNFYDFTQGVDGGLINVGTGPVVVPAIPEPATWLMMITGFGLVGSALRRRRRAGALTPAMG
jgi:PEP-CTERM motif